MAVDFGPFLHATLQSQTGKFRDESLFRTFSIVYGNLVWGDDEMCFPIEDLYEGKIDRNEIGDRVWAVAETRAEYGTNKAKRRKASRTVGLPGRLTV